jgi:multidrug efflux pump subunit AcrA (membrane-fusion protein)
MYVIPRDALKTFKGRQFILAIGEDNKVSPVEVFVYNSFNKTAEIIGKNLKAGMKIVCSKNSGLLILGQKVSLAKKIDF